MRRAYDRLARAQALRRFIAHLPGSIRYNRGAALELPFKRYNGSAWEARTMLDALAEVDPPAGTKLKELA